MLNAVIKVGACIILGATSAVAVAWGLALRGVPISGPWNEVTSAAWVNPSLGDVTVYGEGRAGTGVLRLHLMRGPGTIEPDRIRAQLGGGLRMGQDPPYRRVEAPPRACHPPDGQANCRSEYQFGWPLVCLWGASDTSEGGCMITVLGTRQLVRVWPIGKPLARASFGGDLLFPFSRDPQSQSLFVPTGIMWQPLAIDSGAYGAAWWVVLLAPGIVRRAVRRRLGQCMHCGYSLAGITTGICPECGKAAGILKA